MIFVVFEFCVVLGYCWKYMFEEEFIGFWWFVEDVLVSEDYDQIEFGCYDQELIVVVVVGEGCDFIVVIIVWDLLLVGVFGVMLVVCWQDVFDLGFD